MSKVRVLFEAGSLGTSERDAYPLSQLQFRNHLDGREITCLGVILSFITEHSLNVRALDQLASVVDLEDAYLSW